MDLICLSTLLQELLVKNKRVALPGIGTFVLEDISSVFLLDGKTITPPTKKVFFDTSEIKNDGILEHAYAIGNKISLEEGQAAVLLLMEKIEQTLIGNKRVDIPRFGYISFEDSCNFYFTIDKNFNVCPDSYPLELISLKPECKLPPVVLDEEPFVLEDNSVVECNIIENEVAEGDTVESDMVESEIVESDVDKSSIVESNVAQNDVDRCDIDKDNEHNKSEDVDITSTREVVVEVSKEVVAIEKTKINKWVLIAAIVLLMLIIAIACVYIFREDLTPVLEKLLYTKEELLILKQSGNI